MRWICVIALAVLVAAISAPARIINVPTDYLTIQAGIDASVNGDTVLVSGGLYQENINFLGKNILMCSEYIYTGDTLDVDSTIIDGGAASTVVTFNSGEDSTCVLEGFTITNGYFYRGGGLKCINGSSPFITHNVITGNRAYNDYYAVRGGGIYCDNSNSRIVSNIIRSNTVSHSDASSSGGGLYFVNGNVMIQGNRISGNSAISTGAGMSIISSNGTISGNIIEDNLSYLRAGGMYCQGCTLGIYQNLIVGNNTYAEGGGIYLNSSECDLQNNTIVGNVANYGSAVYTFFEPFMLENTVIWGNTGDLFGADSVVTLNYCDVQDSFFPGIGNISLDPQLTESSHLLSPSPCVDAGDPASPYDPDGTRADIGAYYYHQTQLEPFELVSPIDQAFLTNNPLELVWTHSSHPDSDVIIYYKAYWDTDSTLSSPDSSVDLSDSTYSLLDSLSRSIWYYWMVKAFGIHAFSRESEETRSFYIDDYPSDVALLSPLEGADADSFTVLYWTESTDPDPFDTTTYTLQADDDSTFSSPEIEQTHITDGLAGDDSVSVALLTLNDFTMLKQDSSYFWRVRADDRFGLSSNWSASGSFIFMRRIRVADISLSVASITDTLYQGSIQIDTLVIRNIGEADLIFNITAVEFPPPPILSNISPNGPSKASDKSSAIKQPLSDKPKEILNTWLFVDLSADTLAPSDSTLCQVTLSSASLIEGRYPGELQIRTNAPEDTLIIIPVSLAVLQPGCDYVPGDANGNGTSNGVDVTYFVNYLKGIGPPPPDVCDCGPWLMIFAAADANGSCSANGVDVTYMVNYFKGQGPELSYCEDCPPARK